MRLLVTGGCGFIGANYIHFLFETEPHCEVVNLDKLTYAGNPLNLSAIDSRYGEQSDDPRYAFVRADIADAHAMARLFGEHDFDAVVNFAAESHVDRSIDDPSPFVTTNVLGTQVLLNAARAAAVPRFVHISTDEVYGTLGPEGKFTEATPLAPNSPYSASKASADLMVRSYVNTYGLDAVITRCSNNYGPYQFPEKLIPLMFDRANADQPLPVYGDGSNVRDWIYVRDHCRGVHLALTRGRAGKVYNFGGDAEKNNLEVVRAILEATGKPESLITFVEDRPGHDERYAMDFELARRELGFEPEFDFATGIEKTLTWYRDNAEWLDTVKSGAYRKFMDQWYGERA